jgi:hypothetical protein
MIIAGAGCLPAFQQTAFVDTETGSCNCGDWSTLSQRRSSAVSWRRCHSAEGALVTRCAMLEP